MTILERSSEKIVPISRRWHVIQEVDLVRLIAEHEGLGRLCDQLEAWADALPARPGSANADQLCRALQDLVRCGNRSAHLPLADLLSPDADDPLTAELIDRSRARRAADAAEAQDLITALCPDAGVAEAVSPDTLGYMLRCFFAGCCRALEIEKLAVLALGQHRMTADARALLVDSLCRRSA